MSLIVTTFKGKLFRAKKKFNIGDVVECNGGMGEITQINGDAFLIKYSKNPTFGIRFKYLPLYLCGALHTWEDRENITLVEKAES